MRSPCSSFWVCSSISFLIVIPHRFEVADRGGALLGGQGLTRLVKRDPARLFCLLARKECVASDVAARPFVPIVRPQVQGR